MTRISSVWYILICVLILLGARPSFAAETIRVALTEEATGVHIQGQARVGIGIPGRESFVERPPLVLQPDARGLRINGRVLKGHRVRIWALSGTLPLTVYSQGGGGSRENSHRWELKGLVEIFNDAAKLLVVHHIGLEEYVSGVVTGEINANWPEEALKAQAIAARTYVLYKKMMSGDQPFDVVSTVQDQVYRGQSGVNPKIRKAVQDTRGRVLSYDRRPIFSAYSSTAAGPTEDALYVWALDLPYLKGVECPFDEKAPRYEWRASVPLETLERRLRKSGYEVGFIATVTPYAFTPSGRIDRIRILHSRGQTILRGQDFRRVVGYSKIFSTQFHIERFGHTLIFAGRGAGHGVGLCQWGMKEMAELGYDHEAILRYYYPETVLLPLSKVTLTPPSSS